MLSKQLTSIQKQRLFNTWIGVFSPQGLCAIFLTHKIGRHPCKRSSNTFYNTNNNKTISVFRINIYKTRTYKINMYNTC